MRGCMEKIVEEGLPACRGNSVDQGSPAGLRGHLAISGDILGCDTSGDGCQ